MERKKRVAALVIHGIGGQRPDFAEPLIRGVNREVKRLGADASAIAWQPVYWDDLLVPRQQAYLKRALKEGRLNYQRLRQFVVSALGDAGAYRQRPSGMVAGAQSGRTYERVHARIREQMSGLYHGPLSERPLPLVLMAHSFGGHILSNYVWDSQQTPDRTLSAFERMHWLAGFITLVATFPFSLSPLISRCPSAFPRLDCQHVSKKKRVGSISTIPTTSWVGHSNPSAPPMRGQLTRTFGCRSVVLWAVGLRRHTSCTGVTADLLATSQSFWRLLSLKKRSISFVSGRPERSTPRRVDRSRKAR